MLESKFDILGVDMGTYNIKTDKSFICRSVYNTKTNFNIGTKNILELDGIKYQVGVGSFDTEIIKSKRENLPLFLYAIAKSTDCDNVKVVTGVPHYQFEKTKYVDELKSKFTGAFSFKLEGIERTINVLDVKVFPEGVGAFNTITKDVSNQDIILLDFGGSTINVVYFRNGEFIKAKTLTKGSLNLLTDMLQYVEREYGGRHNIDKVADYIKKKKIGKIDCDLINDTIDLAQPYMDDLLTLLDLEFPKDVADYYVTGGGVEVFLGSIIKNLGADVGLISDYVFANAKGFEAVGRAVYGC